LHHIIAYHLIQARLADLRRDAQRDALARAVRGHGWRRRLGPRPWVRRLTRAVPELPRLSSTPGRATHVPAEPVSGRRGIRSNAMAGAAHRDDGLRNEN
jgi:hypothetical protein